MLEDEPDFPRPMRIKQLRYFDEAQVEAYEQKRRSA
jgi:hypothetical protein